MNPGIWKLY